MRKLNLLNYRVTMLAIVLLSSFIIGLNSCNNSSKSGETKDTTQMKDTNKMMQDTSQGKDTTRSDQVPPPK